MKKNAYEIGTEIYNGLAKGKDPRNMSSEELNNMGHIDTPLLKVIRSKCIDCCGGEQNEVRMCTAVGCQLWPYRMNKNPFRKRSLTDEQRKELADRLSRSRSRN